MILITGATGTIGRTLVSNLLAGGAAVRAMTRDPERARPLLGSEVDLVRGDFADPPSLARALDGADALFLLTAPGPTLVDHDLAMMRAARESRLKRVVKMSAFGTEASPPLRVATWQQPGERAVMESGLAWTLLRPMGFASNVLAWSPALRSGSTIEISTGDGKQAIVDPRDVAAVAARALTSHEHEGKAYTLAGPELLGAHEQIAILERLLERRIATQDITLDVTAERMRAAGLPAALVDAFIEGYGYVREGRAAFLSDDIERVLGRAPRSFEEWARAHLSELA